MGVTNRTGNIPPSRKTSLTAILSALALVGTYLFVAIPNVELGSVVFFIIGLVFGLDIGFSSMIIASIIFSVLNPWGGFYPIIWISQAIAWGVIVVAGYLMGLIESEDNTEPFNAVHLGIIGGFVTLLFDLITDLGYSITFGVPFIAAIITGALYHVAHIASNIIIFAIGIPRIVRIIRSEFAHLIWEQSIDTSLHE